MSTVLKYDPYAGVNGKYVIHSLYFDDYKDTCARENVNGDGRRFKYRIRYYNDESNKLYLEKKEKQYGYCYKRKCIVLPDEYKLIMNGKTTDVFWNTENPLLKEFCIDIMTKRFGPKVVINYEREALIEEIFNIRITFDYNITASDEFDHFLDGDYLKIPILEKGMHVLEVKFDELFPSYIRLILQSNALQQQSFSKYYLGRIAIQERAKQNEYL